MESLKPSLRRMSKMLPGNKYGFLRKTLTHANKRLVYQTLISRGWTHMNYYAGPWDYVENLQSPWRTPRRSSSHTQKQNPNMSWQTRPSRCEFRAQTTTLSLRVLLRFSVHGTRNERVESVTTCWGSVSECGMGIDVGFFTETASFLRNPRVPRNSSYKVCYAIRSCRTMTVIVYKF